MNPFPKLPSGLTYGTLPDGSRQCMGSQMGRPDTLPADRNAPVKLRLQRLRFVDGCYDQGGAYWGAPATIYRALGSASECNHKRSRDPYILKCPLCGVDYDSTVLVEIFVRANSRREAKAKIRQTLPNAIFYR